MSAVDTKDPKVAEPAPIAEIFSGFEDGLAWEAFEFRGVRYKVNELTIGEYDEITKKATSTRKMPDVNGNEVDIEVTDNQLQARLMLKACLSEPAKVDIVKLPTRVTIALNSAVNRIHYGTEPDKLAAQKKTSEDEDDKKGN